MIKNKNAFVHGITGLMVNFNFQPKGDEGVKNFVENLYKILSETFDLTDEQFQKAVKSFLFNGIEYKKFPTASDFLDSIGASPSKLAIKGWVYMKKIVQCHGRYKSVCFGTERKHLALHATIEDLGGWVDMCTRTYIEMEKLEEKFKSTFVDIYTTRQLKKETFLIGTYRTEPIKLGISANLLGYDEDKRKSQIDRIKDEQMKKLGLEE